VASQRSSLYAAFNIIGGSATTITITFSTTGIYQGMMAAEYSNASAIAQHNNHVGSLTAGTANSATSGSVTTSVSGQQIVAFFVNDAASNELTPGTSSAYIRRGSSHYDAAANILTTEPSMLMEDFVQPSAGAINPTATSVAGSGGYPYSGITVALTTAVTGGVESRTSGLVAAYATNFVTTTTTQNLSITTQAGDYLVVYGGGENSGVTLGTPTGNSVAFTLRSSIVTANYCTAYIWTGIDAAGGTSWTLSCTAAAANNWGFGCIVFRGIAGFGNVDKINASSFPAQMAIRTVSTGSSLVVVSTDFNASNGGTTTADISRWWYGINGAVPTVGDGMELVYARNSSAYTAYSALYKNVGSAGNKIVGLRFPDQQIFSMITLEVLPPLVYASMGWLGATASFEFSENFDSYTNATTVTTASNPTLFTSVQSAASGTGTIDNTHFLGTEALKVTGTATSGNQFYVRYNFSAATANTYVRAAFYLTAYPTSRDLIIGIVTPSTDSIGGTDEADIAIAPSTGALQILSAGSPTSIGTTGTNSVPLNQWFSLDCYVDYTNSQLTVRIYDSTGTLTGTVFTNSNGYSGQMPTAVKFGVLGEPATTAPLATLTCWVDSVVADKAGWIGPP
jgi:hypothetical protein